MYYYYYAEGGFIGDAEHCKNFQSSNMIMLYYTKIDRPAILYEFLTFGHLDYNFYICIYVLLIYSLAIFKFRSAHRLRYAPCVAL